MERFILGKVYSIIMEKCSECNEILFICEMDDMGFCDDCFEKIQNN